MLSALVPLAALTLLNGELGVRSFLGDWRQLESGSNNQTIKCEIVSVSKAQPFTGTVRTKGAQFSVEGIDDQGPPFPAIVGRCFADDWTFVVSIKDGRKELRKIQFDDYRNFPFLVGRQQVYLPAARSASHILGVYPLSSLADESKYAIDNVAETNEGRIEIGFRAINPESYLKSGRILVEPKRLHAIYRAEVRLDVKNVPGVPSSLKNAGDSADVVVENTFAASPTDPFPNFVEVRGGKAGSELSRQYTWKILDRSLGDVSDECFMPSAFGLPDSLVQGIAAKKSRANVRVVFGVAGICLLAFIAGWIYKKRRQNRLGSR